MSEERILCLQEKSICIYFPLACLSQVGVSTISQETRVLLWDWLRVREVACGDCVCQQALSAGSLLRLQFLRKEKERKKLRPHSLSAQEGCTGILTP